MLRPYKENAGGGIGFMSELKHRPLEGFAASLLSLLF